MVFVTRPPEKVTFTFLKVTFSREKMVFRILKVTFSELKTTFSYINMRINIRFQCPTTCFTALPDAGRLMTMPRVCSVAGVPSRR